MGVGEAIFEQGNVYSLSPSELFHSKKCSKKYTFFWVSAHCARGPSIWPSSSNRIDALKNHDVYKISLAISIIKVKFLFLRWFAVKSAMNFKEIVQFGGYFWDPCEVKKKIIKKITNYILAQYLLQYFFLFRTL